MDNKKNQKELDTSLKLIFKSSLFVFCGVFLSKILSYFYRVVVARYFGPEVYGLFSLAMMILLLITAIASLGLYQGALRFTSLYRGKNKQNKIRYLFKISTLYLFVSGILFAILLYLSSEFISINIFHNADLIIFIKIFSIIVPFQMLFYLFLAFIQAHERIKAHSFILDFLENFLKFVFLVTLIFLGLKTNAVIFSYFLGVLFVFLVSFIYCKYKIPSIFFKYKLKNTLKKQIKKELISYSWPLIFSTIIYSIAFYIDSFVLGYYKDAITVGLYNAAIPIAVLLTFFPNLFMRLFFPLITKEFSRKNIKVIRELSKQVQKWILITNLPVFFLILVFPGVFMNTLFGAEYIVASNALRFLSVGFLFYSLSIVSNTLISMVGKSKTILVDVTLISIINFILNIILIPKFGLTGAAFATMTSNIILTLIFIYQGKRYTSIVPIRRKMLGIVLSTILPTLLILYIRRFIPINLLTMLLQGVLFSLFYLLLIFLTKSFDKNDIMIIKSVTHKIKQ